MQSNRTFQDGEILSFSANSSNSHPLSRKEIFRKTIVNLIEERLSDSSLNSSALARMANLSVSQLNRKLNHTFGCSASILIRNIRMQRAAALLIEDIAPVGEIAFSIGYENQASFFRNFKKVYGSAPGSYVREQASMLAQNAQNCDKNA